ncbi:hypothetical protein DMS56_26280 [Klebsiella variicola]|nr:hypothetical protein DMS66_22475 [Klebsiella variicola]PXL41663.1 hypothetical protein DMS47_21165 [Klebsiella variicola]PXL62955.1 hypothetical protein DMS56_26280 [Klebsiella variicola]
MPQTSDMGVSSFDLLHGKDNLSYFCFVDSKNLVFPAFSCPAPLPLAATDRSETATRCYEALIKRHAHHIYLCLLDCAGDIPQIKTA